MRELAEWVLVVILFIAAFVVVIQVNSHNDNIATCLASQYKTKDHKLTEENKLMCRSSDNGYQILKESEL